MQQDETSGVWSVVLPPLPDGSTAIEHGSRVKITLGVEATSGGQGSLEFVDRVPAWIKYALPYRTPDGNNVMFEGIFWNSKTPYQWKHEPVPFNSVNFSMSPSSSSSIIDSEGKTFESPVPLA